MSKKFEIKPYGILDLDFKYNNPMTGQPQINYPANNKFLVNNVLAPLNIYKERKRIFNAIHNNQVIIFEAGTGSGKTVAMPLLVLHYFDYQPIICTQPRKNLVDDKTNFISLLLGVPVQITDKNRNVIVEDTGMRYVGKQYGGGLAPGWKTDDTRLLWATDAMIKVLIAGGDTLLKNYNAILIDETHERSIHIDILMALCAKICLKRPEFKLIIMSATINVKQFQDYFNRIGLGDRTGHVFVAGTGGIVIPPGVELIKHEYYDDLNPGAKPVPVANRVKVAMEEVDKLLKDTKTMERIFGDENYENYDNYKFPNKPKQPLQRFFKYGRDILVFAPTKSAPDKFREFITENMSKYKYKPICIGYNGSTSDLTEGKIATNKNALMNTELMGDDVGKYDLKLIIATNSAEAGVTFEDPLGFVFETGTQNNVFFRPNENYDETGIFDIAKDNISQRKGRTGRINPGVARFMYTKKQYNNFQEFKDTDITQNNITTDILALMNIEEFNSVYKSIDFLKDMIEPVENYVDIIRVAYRNLIDYDFVDSRTGDITELGKVCSLFGMYDYHIARMLIMGYHLNVLKEVIYLGAIIQLSLNEFDDIYNKEVEQVNINEQKSKALQNFINPSGDHLSYLTLFIEWLKVPDYQKQIWEETYNLQWSQLNRIKRNADELMTLVLRNINEIRKLNLFVIYDRYKASGGGNTTILNTTDNIQSEYLINNPKSLFNVKDLNLSFIKNMYGGENTNIVNNISENTNKNIDEIFNMDVSIDRIIDKALKDKLFLNVDAKIQESINLKGERIAKTTEVKQEKERRKERIEERKENKKQETEKQIKDKKNEKKNVEKTKLEKKNVEKPKIEKKNVEKPKIDLEKQKKIKEEIQGDSLSFKGIFKGDEPVKLRNMSKYNKAERVLISLTFGYLNQIAMLDDSNTDSNKYFVRYSNEKGIIKNSILTKYLNRKPKTIIYNNFSKTTRGSILNMITELPSEIIFLFKTLKLNF